MKRHAVLVEGSLSCFFAQAWLSVSAASSCQNPSSLVYGFR